MIAGELNNEEIKEYIKLCAEKRTFHLNNAVSAMKWHQLLTFVNVLLTSATALSMTVLTVLKADDVSVAVVGGCFAFAIAIASRIQENYGFRILNYQHSELSNDFQELENSFYILSLKLHSQADFELLTVRYLGINARTNIMTVRHCVDLCCCYT